jgi:2-amino-4-hydroxy-6-hydroxymethyldihydropteridine diphosphokinase
MPQITNPACIKATTSNVTETGILLLAFGANISGRWGRPRETFCRALVEIEALGLTVLRASHLYLTRPIGPQQQPPFFNAVIAVGGHLAPGTLLRSLKTIERRAGRQLGPRWGPRPLDIDVLDYGGRRLGWPVRRRCPGRLILPHPEVHKRAFALVPLLEVAPHWAHPALGISGRRLLQNIELSQRSSFGQKLDSGGYPCENHSK